MNDEAKRKQEPPLKLDMGFEEALTRYATTDPAEIGPAPGKTKKKRPRLRMLAPLVNELPPRVGRGK